MLQYATYSVISPEGCASILWKSADKAPEAAETLGITAHRLKTLGLVDKVVSEPVGGRAPRSAGGRGLAQEGARRGLPRAAQREAEAARRGPPRAPDELWPVQGSRRALTRAVSSCAASAWRWALSGGVDSVVLLDRAAAAARRASLPPVRGARAPWPEPERRRLGALLPRAVPAMAVPLAVRRVKIDKRGRGLEAAARAARREAFARHPAR
jgi:hypothetical protein